MHRMIVDFSAPNEDSCWDAELFFKDLEEALTEICPAVELVVDTRFGDGKPKTGHVELDTNSLCSSKYCAHRAGCNLLLDLLRRPADTNEFLPSSVIVQGDKSRFWPSSPMKVEWKPPYYIMCSGLEWPWEDCRPVRCVGCFKGPQPMAALLAHELIHAWHHQMGEYCFPGIRGWESPEEICTVQAENQIRREMGEPTRCSYDGKCLVFPIPNSELRWQVSDKDCKKGSNSGMYDCILLDPTADRENCGCRPYRPSLWSLGKNLVYCWAMRALPFFPKDSSPEQFVPQNWRERSGFDPMFQEHLDPLPEDSQHREMEGLTEFLMARREALVGDRLERQFASSRDALILESVSVHGAYTLVAYFSSSEGVRFITNLRLPSQGREPPFDPSGNLTDEVLLPGAGQTALDLLERGTIAEFPEGIGGLFGLVDGGADFLQVKSDGVVRTTAARNLGDTVLPEGIDEGRVDDPGDSLRWAAIQAIWELGRRTRAELGSDSTSP